MHQTFSEGNVNEPADAKTVSLQEALQAQKALRSAAGMGEERFPVDAFVGMISDEIEALRKAGRTDEAIVALIREGSGIELSAEELRANYATPKERHPHEGSGGRNR